MGFAGVDFAFAGVALGLVAVSSTISSAGAVVSSAGFLATLGFNGIAFAEEALSEPSSSDELWY
jgi:hypothetical protein